MITSDLDPRCGCCGAGSETTLWRVVQDPEMYRCEKHRRRIPCLVEGCGRTYEIQFNRHEGYQTQVLCGKHWQQAPKYMRSAVARVRHLGLKLDWPKNIRNRHHRLWLRCVRYITDGPMLDESKIREMFGWNEKDEL